jgi:uncharacterized RDD family membrane protein YckC
MFCGTCGASNNDAVRYCSNCGGLLTAPARPVYAAAGTATQGYTAPQPTYSAAAASASTSAPGASVIDPTAYATVRYPNFFARFFAFLIDEILVGALVGAVLGAFTLVAYLMAAAGVLTNNGGTGVFGGFVFWLLGFPAAIAAYIFYFVAQETGVNQATLGKRILNMKVTNMTGGTITVGQSLGRLLIKNLLSDFIFFIGFIMAASTERKQALHDLAAGTLVVER